MKMKMLLSCCLLIVALGVAGCTQQVVRPNLLRNATRAEATSRNAFEKTFLEQWHKKYSNEWVYESDDPEQILQRIQTCQIHFGYYGVHPVSRAFCYSITILESPKLPDLLETISAAFDESGMDSLNLMIRRTTQNTSGVVARIYLSRPPASNRAGKWNYADWFGEPAPSNNNPSSQ